MKDDAMKRAGPPDSLSRKEEKKNKRNTDKKRRQGDRKEIQRSLTEKTLPTLKEFLVQESADAEIDCPVCGGTGAMWHMGDREQCDECFGERKIKPSELTKRGRELRKFQRSKW